MIISEIINGTIKTSEFISDGFDKGQEKKRVCTVVSVGITLCAGVIGWYVWRDSVKKKNKEDEIIKKSEAQAAGILQAAGLEIQKIKTAEEEKRKTFAENENKKQETNRKKEEEKRETDRRKAELQKEVADHRAKIRQQEKTEKQTNAAPGLKDWLQGYKQTHRRGTSDKLEMRNLIFPWMTEGYDIGLLAPTDCGKTTFVLQVAMALSKGTCDYPISPQYGTIKPIRTLVFSLEQSEMDINTYYGDILNRVRLLTIRSGEWFGETPTAQILEEIQQEMMAAGSGEGIVVIIDNFTKLVSDSNHAQVEQFCKSLDRMRHASIEAGNPLTVLKVFHVNKDCRIDRRFTEDCFRGDSKFLYETQNVLYLTYCKEGDDKRVLGFIKWKNGNKRQLWILQYTNTSPYQYRYVEPGKEKDLGIPSDEEEPKRKKVGRPEEISLEDACFYYRQRKIEKRPTEEIEKKAGVKWDSIYKRLQREGLLETLNAEVAEKGTGCSGKTSWELGQINPTEQMLGSTKV